MQQFVFLPDPNARMCTVQISQIQRIFNKANSKGMIQWAKEVERAKTTKTNWCEIGDDIATYNSIYTSNMMVYAICSPLDTFANGRGASTIIAAVRTQTKMIPFSLWSNIHLKQNALSHVCANNEGVCKYIRAHGHVLAVWMWERWVCAHSHVCLYVVRAELVHMHVYHVSHFLFRKKGSLFCVPCTLDECGLFVCG